MALVTRGPQSCHTEVPRLEPAAVEIFEQIDATPEQEARNVSASFDLRGGDQNGELRLVSPLGTLIAVATWTPDQARLATPEGTQTYPDLDALSRQALGEALPLRALPDWLAGRPWRGAASQASPSGFEQLGWQVDLARFADGWVDARRSVAPVVLVRARLQREP